MPETENDKTNSGAGLERMIALSDGVVGVAITLMALEIAIPDGTSAAQLPAALTGQITTFLSYVLSFVLVALYWMEHNRIFKLIRRSDSGLVWLNLLFLFLIVLVPFATDLIDRFGDQAIAAALYAGLMMLLGLSTAAIWRYATHKHRLVDADMPERTIRWGGTLRLIPPAVFLVSIPVIFINTSIGTYMWVALFPLMGWFHTRR
jgi:uncharacterized membrane protein